MKHPKSPTKLSTKLSTATSPNLPLIDGVSPSRLYLEKLTPTPESLFAFLCDKFPHVGADVWRQRFMDAQVFDEWGRALDLSSAYRHGVSVFYYRHVSDEVIVPFTHEIIFENDELLVVDKPHFLTTAPAGRYVKETLLSRLKDETGNGNLSPIHRLDKDTAGLLLISKNPATRHAYQQLFAAEQIHKTYHAIAPYRPLDFPLTLSLHLARGEPFYTMQAVADKTPNTATVIDVLDVQGEWAKYELTPSTGKLHQLRVHMAHLGIAIKNDPYYPSVKHRFDDDFSRPLQLLAKALTFNDPVTGEVLGFVSGRELGFPSSL